MDNILIHVVNPTVLAQLNMLIWSMMTRRKVFMSSETRDSQVIGVVNSITAEDGSGTKYIVKFSNQLSIYADLVDTHVREVRLD